MASRIGRVTLTTALGVPYRSQAATERIAGPYMEKCYELRGREHGASASATMDLLERESLRTESMWCEDDDGIFPAGHYSLEDVNYEKPGGAPKMRPWSLALRKKQRPVIHRQAEDDEVAGTPTNEGTADEGSMVVYTPTTSEVLVLDPRNVVGAEELNLPAGTWRFLARVQTKTNVSQKFRLKTTQTGGTVITSGSQVTVGAGNNDAWTVIDLGAFTIGASDSAANWFELHVQGVTSELGNVWLDRITVVPVS